MSHGSFALAPGSLGEGVDLRYAARLKTRVYLAANALGQKVIVKPKAVPPSAEHPDSMPGPGGAVRGTPSHAL
jgi:hypothetical protein